MGRSRGLRTVATAATAAIALALGACTSSKAPSSQAVGAGGGGGSTGASSRLVVDATVAPIADIVREVVGDRVELVGLIPEGVDSHTFEPSPATVKSLSKASILFMDGLHLEGATLIQANANMPRPVAKPTSADQSITAEAKGSEIIQLGDMTISPADYAFDFTFPKAKGDPNPHLWMNPLYGKHWSEIIRDVMVRRDPANAAYYQTNQARFAAVLDQLDPAIAAAINSIPPDQRKLLTYHDSFAYFSRRYGIPVIGAVQPSDFSEPSPKEIQQLIDQVKTNRVPAIFGSEVFPSTVLKQVANEAHAQYVDQLRDDELPGDPNASDHTYIGLMVSDVQIMTRALGGDPGPLSSVPTMRTWQP